MQRIEDYSDAGIFIVIDPLTQLDELILERCYPSVCSTLRFAAHLI